MDLRVGLVGCGFIGRVHSWALASLRKAGLIDATVTALCDKSDDRAQTLAQPHGAAVAGDIETVLDSVDVVYVCTPTAEHAVIVEAAVERGLAVYCEKPLAPDLAGAERVAAALERVPHQVGLVLRCAPVFERLVETISSGRYGHPMVASLRDDQYFPIQGRYDSTWRSLHEMSGGGTLIEHSIHDLDLMRWLLGDAATMSCRTSSFFEHPGIDDLAIATLGYTNGAAGNLVSVWHQVMTRPSTRRLEVFCEQGFLWTDDDNTGPLHIETSAGSDVVECPAPAWVDELAVPDAVRKPLGLYAAASLRFLASVEAGSAGSPGAGEALAAHRLVDAAYRSAAAGGRPLPI